MKYNRLYAAFIFAFWQDVAVTDNIKRHYCPKLMLMRSIPRRKYFFRMWLTLNIYHWKQMRKCCFRVQ